MEQRQLDEMIEDIENSMIDGGCTTTEVNRISAQITELGEQAAKAEKLEKELGELKEQIDYLRNDWEIIDKVMEDAYEAWTTIELIVWTASDTSKDILSSRWYPDMAAVMMTYSKSNILDFERAFGKAKEKNK